MAENRNDYYFWNNELFFVFSTQTYYFEADGNMDKTVNEFRFYFDNKTMIRYLDSEKKSVSKDSPEFKTEEVRLLNNVEQFIKDYLK
jgi:hypothetical protein